MSAGVPWPKPCYVNNKLIYYTNALLKYFKDCMEIHDNDFSIEVKNLNKWTLYIALESMDVKPIDKGQFLASDIYKFLVDPDNRDILFNHIHDILKTSYPWLFKKPESKPEPEEDKEAVEQSLFSDEELDQILINRDSEL